MRGWSKVALAAAFVFVSVVSAHSRQHPVPQTPQWGWGYTPTAPAAQHIHVHTAKPRVKTAKLSVARHRQQRAEPADISNAGPVAVAAGRYLGGNPTGWAHNWCARFLNMVLRETGIQGTKSDAASSFARIGSPASGPAPGEIAILRGGHHVGVVLAVVDGGRGVLIRSGNHGHRVADGVYRTAGAVFRRI